MCHYDFLSKTAKLLTYQNRPNCINLMLFGRLQKHHQLCIVDLPWNDPPLTISQDTHPPNQLQNQLTPHSPFEQLTINRQTLAWFLTIELPSYKRARKSAAVVVKTVSTHSICNWPCRVLIFHPAFESPFAVPKLTTVGTSTPSEEIETSLNHPRTCVVMVIIISNNGALNFLGFGDGAFSDQPSIHHMKSNMIVFVFRLPRPQREYIYERTFEIHNRLN